MAYGDFKDLAKRTAADKVFRNKEFNIARDPKYDGYQKELASMVYKFFDKKTARSGIKSTPQNKRPLDLAMQQSAENFHKAIIRKFKKRKVYSTFKDNIWCADLANMQLISKFKFRFLLCVIDIFSKYAWVVPLKDKKGAKFLLMNFKEFYKNLIENKIRYG